MLAPDVVHNKRGGVAAIGAVRAVVLVTPFVNGRRMGHDLQSRGEVLEAQVARVLHDCVARQFS